MILATLRGSLGQGPHFLMNCELLLDAPWAIQGHHVDPMGCHCVARDLIFDEFLVTSVQNPIFS